MCHCKNKQTIPTCHGNGLARFEVGNHQAWIRFASTTFQDPAKTRKKRNELKPLPEAKGDEQTRRKPARGWQSRQKQKPHDMRRAMYTNTNKKHNWNNRTEEGLKDNCHRNAASRVQWLYRCSCYVALRPFNKTLSLLSMLRCMCMERWQPPLPNTNSIPSLILYCARTNVVDMLHCPHFLLGRIKCIAADPHLYDCSTATKLPYSAKVTQWACPNCEKQTPGNVQLWTTRFSITLSPKAN